MYLAEIVSGLLANEDLPMYAGTESEPPVKLELHHLSLIKLSIMQISLQPLLKLLLSSGHKVNLHKAPRVEQPTRNIKNVCQIRITKSSLINEYVYILFIRNLQPNNK